MAGSPTAITADTEHRSSGLPFFYYAAGAFISSTRLSTDVQTPMQAHRIRPDNAGF
ncbi:hypothetical protein [Escherichia coli]|uniref:hypothetical protein n=1 Tax=Escherichia coli TaxID=562 RepID=UPI0039A08AD3